MDTESPRLRLAGISKRYASTQANADVDLVVGPGEIHALLGENGAGKSTLVKMISGLVKPDTGTITWSGTVIPAMDPDIARGLGIAMVFQHFSLFETLTVAENIALGLRTKESMAALSARIADTAGRYGLKVDPGRHVHHLSVGERQRVEIVRCLLQDPKLLIMDEPTSVLTPQEVDGLFIMLRRLAAEGCSILYISHKLEEIAALCHAATVLRAGRVVAHCNPQQETPATMAELMVGRTLAATIRSGAAPGAPCLTVTGLSLAAEDPFGTTLRDIGFTLYAGEIMGIAGVAGNGQKELLAVVRREEIGKQNAAVAPRPGRRARCAPARPFPPAGEGGALAPPHPKSGRRAPRVSAAAGRHRRDRRPARRRPAGSCGRLSSPVPRRSTRPAMAGWGRTMMRSPETWTSSRSSPTSRAKRPRRPASAMSANARALFPVPEGPRMTTACSPTTTAVA